MAIRGIAFDLEGTVIDLEAAHQDGHLAAAAEFGLVLSLEEAHVKLPHFIGGPNVYKEIWELLDPEVQKSIPPEEVRLRDIFHYEQLLAKTPIEPRPGFLDFYKKAADRGLAFTIGSTTPQKQAAILLGRSGLAELFPRDAIVLREQVENLKPAPDVFLKTASLMGVHPSEQLVFEDSPRGIRAALAAGSSAVGMPVVIAGATVGELVNAGACRIFFDWREIDACALIENLG